jgi:glucose/arabinose dehydrogenase
MMPRAVTGIGLALLLAACGTGSGAGPHSTTRVSSSPSAVTSPTPAPYAYNLESAAGIQVPNGFRAVLFARGLDLPTAMAFGPDGRLYVTSSNGSVSVVSGPAAAPQPLVSGLPAALGLAWRGNDLFVSVRGAVLAYHLDGQNLSGGGAVASGLPAGRHQNDNLLLMPNGDFLLGVGSTCDVCTERDARSAAVLRFHSDWGYAGVVVKGARNPYGLALRPYTGEAYLTINGQDNLGGAEPADHLVRIEDGADAGWPRCWPSYRDRSLHGNCAGVLRPIAFFEPHSSADGIVFYQGKQFGSDYTDNAFVAEWGANAGGSVGRRVVRVVLRAPLGEEIAEVTDFATGFDHPVALAQATDGGLLVADYGRGQIIEIIRG